MRLPKFRYAVLVGRILGFTIPVVLIAFAWLEIFDLPTTFLFIWPSSIMVPAIGTLRRSTQARAILPISIGWNVLYYVVVFVLIWSVGWVLRAWRASLRDGTTI